MERKNKLLSIWTYYVKMENHSISKLKNGKQKHPDAQKMYVQ